MNCPNCNVKLLKGARFCHSCGTEIVAAVKPCPSCSSKNPATAKFCHSCGQSMKKETSNNRKKKKEEKPVYKAIYPIDFLSNKTIESQIKDHFFTALKDRVNTQSNLKKYSEYLQEFYSSGYSKEFENHSAGLEHFVRSFKDMDRSIAEVKIDQLLDDGFEVLLDRFTITHTRHLNDIQLSNGVLRYEFLDGQQIDVEQMIFDYLDLDNENQNVFTDFPNMPINKLRNASKSFLFPARDEPILLIGDQSVLGSCKEGFAFTTRGLYWRAHFNKPHKVYYTELYEVKRVGDWITINSNYFHVNKSLNFKILKLLKKLKSIH